LSVVLGIFALLSVARSDCEQFRITGYVAGEYPGLTADGSTTTLDALARGELLAAAGYDVPMGSFLDVDGLGVYRVADRGQLGYRHLDLLVATRSEAFALTGYRRVCWVG